MVTLIHASYYMTDARADGAVPDHPVSQVLIRFWIGVPIFFVISGYCISASADGLRRRPVALGTYFRRRFRRIFPAWWAATAMTLVAVVLIEVVVPGLFTEGPRTLPHPAKLTAAQWFGNVTLTETWRPHLFGPDVRFLLFPGWTLAYEEQFYAVVGLLLVLSRRHFFLNALLLSVAVGLIFAADVTGRLPFPVNGFFFDGRWLFFAAGILVYWLVNYGEKWHGTAGIVTLLLPGVALLAVLPDVLLGDSPTLVQEGFVAFGFAALLVAIQPFDKAWAASRPLQPIFWCGVRCYSIYLVHWPVVKAVSHVCHELGVRGLWPTLLVSLPACIIATLLVGDAFYRHIERRFLNAPLVTLESRGVSTPTEAYPLIPPRFLRRGKSDLRPRT